MRQSLARYIILGSCLLTASAQGQDKPVKPFFDPVEGCRNDCLCVSRDGKKLALNAWTFWDISSGKPILSGKTRCCSTSAFSPDGSLFAIGGSFSELFIFDARTGKEYWNLTLSGHGDSVVDHLEFTPDGRFLVSTSINGMMRVWDLKAKKAVALFCFTSKYDVCNGWKDYLAAWRMLAGEKPPDDVKTFVIFEKPICCIEKFAISPDSKYVAVPLDTPEVWLIELQTGKIVKTIRTDQVATKSIRFSNRGHWLVIGGGNDPFNSKTGAIEVWDLAAGKRLVTCSGHRSGIYHLAISPDDKTIISGGVDDGVRVWDSATGKQRYALYQDGRMPIVGLAFLPDGKTFLTLPHALNLPVHFWDLASGKAVSPIQAKPKE